MLVGVHATYFALLLALRIARAPMVLRGGCAGLPLGGEGVQDLVEPKKIYTKNRLK